MTSLMWYSSEFGHPQFEWKNWERRAFIVALILLFLALAFFGG